MSKEEQRKVALTRLFGDFDYPKTIYDTMILPNGEVKHSVKNEVVNFAIEKVNQTRREKIVDTAVKKAQNYSQKKE